MDFKENVKIGGGPVETGASYYKQKQISVLGFAVHFTDEYGNLTMRYFDFLSEILSHDSLFVVDCISKLLSQSFMARFKNIFFWSDSGPHFRSGEVLDFVFDRLPRDFPEKSIYLNFFAEYHGKSVVDGHFGVLSNWLKDGMKVRYIRSIDDLVAFFREKAGSGFCKFQVDFDTYSRHGRPSLLRRMIVKDFRSYLSFARTRDKLFASTLSTMKEDDYKEVNFKVKVQKDERKTKYAPQNAQTETAIPVVMGSRSQQTLLTRMKLTGDPPDPMELTECTTEADAMEVDEV